MADAIVQIVDNRAQVVINGASLLGPLVDAASGFSDEAKAAAAVYLDSFSTVVPPGSGPYADAVSLVADRIAGTLISAVLSDGTTYDPVAAERDILATGPRSLNRGMVVGVVGQGQSNGDGELDFSQRPGNTNRAPDAFDPTIDGPAVITTDRAGRSDTFDGASIVPFTGAPYGAYTGNQPAGETCTHGFVGQMLARQPALKMCVSVAGCQGSTPLSGLRRPTTAEITAGSMAASSGAIAIPNGSLEKQWLAANVSLRDLHTLTGAAATPWFRDAWSQSIIRQLYAQQGNVYVVGYMPMQHGEALPTEIYTQPLADFYDEKQACWREITGQQFDALMISEVASYSPYLEITGGAGYVAWVNSGKLASYAPGGANSQYLPDAQRSNGMFQRDLDLIATQGFGGRRIVASGPKYAMTSNIHHDQWTARWAGEVLAWRAWCEDFSGRKAGPLSPLSVQFVSANEVIVHFDRRVQIVPPVRNGNTNFPRGAGAGVPFGFALYYGDGIGVHPIPDDGVTMGADGYSVVITTSATESGPIAEGHILTYLNIDRFGSICTVDEMPLIYPDRDAGPTEAREYCLPFKMVIQ